MKLLSALVFGLLLLVAAPAAKADGCADIESLSDRWHKLANYIDEHSDEGKLQKREIAKVSRDTKALVPFTKAFGDALAKEGKGKDTARLRALGKQISAAVEELGELGETDDWDEDVKIIDRLVEVLDKVVDSCA